MKAEHKLVIELCKFKNPDPATLLELLEQPLDFACVLGLLLYNRMGGVAYGVLESQHLLQRLNREVKSTLETVYLAQQQKTQCFLQALRELAVLLERVIVPYAVLKGATLASIYPLGYRTSNDVDILVRQQDVTPVTDLLRGNGFKQGYVMSGAFVEASRREILASKLNRGETVPFIKEINAPQMRFLEIDINFSLDFKAEKDERALEMFLDPSRLQKDKNGLFHLDPSYFVLHLCAHLYKEATVFPWVEMGRDLSFYKFSDLYMLLDSFTENTFVQLETAVLETSLLYPCYYALFYTRALYDLHNPKLDAFLKRIQPKNLDFLYSVNDPIRKKVYRYTKEQSFAARLFSHDRARCLMENEQ